VSLASSSASCRRCLWCSTCTTTGGGCAYAGHTTADLALCNTQLPSRTSPRLSEPTAQLAFIDVHAWCVPNPGAVLALSYCQRSFHPTSDCHNSGCRCIG
jgi:hypothetical protein